LPNAARPQRRDGGPRAAAAEADLGEDRPGGRALLEVLGAGGMATVYWAVDQALGREVAVKVLSPQYARDQGFLVRFEREARHVAALSDPRIVTVFDCGIEGSTPFIVMELVKGPTLRRVLDETGPLPPDEAVTIAAAVCDALSAAHAAGLVHRDIKPANIMPPGRHVKVLDFGIARAEDRSPRSAGHPTNRHLSAAVRASAARAGAAAPGQASAARRVAASRIRCAVAVRWSAIGDESRGVWRTSSTSTSRFVGEPGCDPGGVIGTGKRARSNAGRPAAADGDRAVALRASYASAIRRPRPRPECVLSWR
jgi:serine/threonine protein kinase